MRAQSSLSEEQRKLLVSLFEQGIGYKAAARQLDVSYRAVHSLHNRWKLRGRLCLMDKPTKQQYPFEVKKEVVTRFLNCETRMDLAREFGLFSEELVKTWMRAWRKDGDEALMPKTRGRPKGSTAKPKELTEEDKLRRQVAKLQAENAYLKNYGT